MVTCQIPSFLELKQNDGTYEMPTEIFEEKKHEEIVDEVFYEDESWSETLKVIVQDDNCIIDDEIKPKEECYDDVVVDDESYLLDHFQKVQNSKDYKKEERLVMDLQKEEFIVKETISMNEESSLENDEQMSKVI